MPRFAANLTMLYNEVPFLDRFAAAAADGFKAVEFLFPYVHTAEEIRRKVDAAGVDVVLFNLPPGNWDAGERGTASLPGRERQFAESVAKALDYAGTIGCKRLHAPAGIAANIDPARARATYVANLKLAAERLAPNGITLLIEPINTRDMPGFYLNRQDHAHEIRKTVGAVNLRVQMDLYHCQIVEGDVATKLKQYIAHVGHMQIAGVPDRHEPDEGEVNYPYLFDLIDRLGYQGWIGAEYRPRTETSAGLGWVKPYL